MDKQFEKLDSETRAELENILKSTIVELFRQDAIEESFYKYEVQLQDLRFITNMSDEELERSIKLTIDLLEEIKAINNSGMDGTVFRKKVTEIEEQYEDEDETATYLESPMS